MIPRWQADDLVPTGALNALGALKIHAQRTQIVYGLFNTAGIAVTTYYSAPVDSLTIPGTAVRPFTTLTGWLATIVVLGVIYLVVDRGLLYPAEVSYRSHEASDRERNPGYDVTVDTNELVQQIAQAVGVAPDGGQEPADDD